MPFHPIPTTANAVPRSVAPSAHAVERLRSTGGVLLLCAAVLIGLSGSTVDSVRSVERSAAVSLSTYPPPVESPARTATLMFAGDVMAHDVLYTRRPYSRMFERIAPIVGAADIAFANLEFTIDRTRPLSNYPRFNVHPDYVEAVVAAGFDAFSAANNHVADHGRPGAAETVRALEDLRDRYDISYSGLDLEQGNEMRFTALGTAGIRIGFMAVTGFNNENRGNGYVYSASYANETARERLRKLVRGAAGEFDVIVLSYHGGVEYASKPSEPKAAFFRELVQDGVDILWGHHPHVLQPWEIVQTSRGEGLILYSTGNLISGQRWHSGPDQTEGARAATGDSALYFITVCVTQAGRVDIRRVHPRLVTNVRRVDAPMTVVPFEPLLRELRTEQWRQFFEARMDATRSMVRPMSTYGLVP